MRLHIYILFVLGLTNLIVKGQSDNWITLNKPQTGVVGKLILANVLSKDKIDTSLIQSEDGADQYKEEASRHFSLNLKVSKFDKLKYLSVSIDTMVIDYLKDAALFNNDNYLTNYFVYKALRAKSVTYYFKKSTSIVIDPKEILNDTILKSIAKQIPLFDSLNISYTSGDSVAIKISNPRVYFQVIGMQLKNDNCKRCRISFGAALGSPTDDFIMDLEDQQKYNATIYIPEGTKPVYSLYLSSDDKDTSKVKIFLSFDEGFRKANNNFLVSPLEVPYKDITIKGKSVRRFTFQPTEFYIGSIISTTKKFLRGDISLNIPVFVSVNGEQKTSTTVNFINSNSAGLLLTKVEYPTFSYTVYKGIVQ